MALCEGGPGPSVLGWGWTSRFELGPCGDGAADPVIKATLLQRRCQQGGGSGGLVAASEQGEQGRPGAAHGDGMGAVAPLQQLQAIANVYPPSKYGVATVAVASRGGMYTSSLLSLIVDTQNGRDILEGPAPEPEPSIWDEE